MGGLNVMSPRTPEESWPLRFAALEATGDKKRGGRTALTLWPHSRCGRGIVAVGGLGLGALQAPIAGSALRPGPPPPERSKTAGSGFRPQPWPPCPVSVCTAARPETGPSASELALMGEPCPRFALETRNLPARPSRHRIAGAGNKPIADLNGLDRGLCRRPRLKRSARLSGN